MNIPGLIKIEYIAKTAAIIASSKNVECEYDEFTGSFTEIEFVPTTGGFITQQVQQGRSNVAYETTLSFFVPNPTAAQKETLMTLSGPRYVYRVTDPQGQQYIIGDQNVAGRLSFSEQVDPTYTGQRGYAVTVSCKNIRGPLIYNPE
jgi:hypothetical protein